MAALGISILSPVDLLPGGEIDVHRVPLLGIHNGETQSEFPGLDELTSARVLGRLLYAVAGASFKPSSRTLETSENTEILRSPSARSSVLADVPLAAGFPGGRFRCVQRLRKPRRQPQVSGVVVRRVLQQEAAGRLDAPEGLPEVAHQLFEHGVFVCHGPTVHSAGRSVPDSQTSVRDRGYGNVGEGSF
jgi:hypothetical protein